MNFALARESLSEYLCHSGVYVPLPHSCVKQHTQARSLSTDGHEQF